MSLNQNTESSKPVKEPSLTANQAGSSKQEPQQEGSNMQTGTYDVTCLWRHKGMKFLTLRRRGNGNLSLLLIFNDRYLFTK